MNWIRIEDRLPEPDQLVLVRTNKTNVRGRSNTLWCYDVVQFVPGHNKEFVEEIGTWRFGDEGHNNERPYGWDGGIMTYFGQDVTHWLPIEGPTNDE